MSKNSSNVPRSRYAGFDALPVRIHVRVGRASLSTTRLAELKPGDLIRLDQALGAPFRMCAGEVLLGSVEPVATEEGLAVKLVAPAEDG